MDPIPDVDLCLLSRLLEAIVLAKFPEKILHGIIIFCNPFLGLILRVGSTDRTLRFGSTELAGLSI